MFQGSMKDKRLLGPVLADLSVQNNVQGSSYSGIFAQGPTVANQTDSRM